MSSLAGLVANYGDSDEEREDYRPIPPRSAPSAAAAVAAAPEGYENAAIHPPPIPHCPWSACYDESSGFTYYWNQLTNAVTWEAPPEYLLALKVAQQQLNAQGSAEVSAEEWQLYQQALAEKQTSQSKSSNKSTSNRPSSKKPDSKEKPSSRGYVRGRKRPASDDEDEKIELITSYHNSDSESNDETESPKKSSSKPQPIVTPAPKPTPPTQVPKPSKKIKKQTAPQPYGPPLPPNMNYTIPIGPELPPELVAPKSPEKLVTTTPVVIVTKDEEKKTPKSTDTEDSQDESLLLMKLKDKAKLLEKLGGEIPSELKEMIKDEPKSDKSSPIVSENKKGADIDDLLAEIEKKELPKVKSKAKIDIFEDDTQTNDNSAKSSPRSTATPPLEEIKTLFPSSKAIESEPEEKPTSLFPSAANITPEVQENGVDKPMKSDTPPPLPPEKKPNIYLSDSVAPSTSRKKFRISNSVLPERPKTEPPSYTTKYSSHIEGFSSERTGLGFSKDDETDSTPKETVSYGNGLMFTKGEILNEDKKDEELDDMVELVEAKLKFLNQVQPSMVTPVQEMLIQMQTLLVAWRAGALGGEYWRRWVSAASSSLAQQEAAAAPPGWTCAFQRSCGRYQYVRQADGLAQWDYPLPPSDMDICTTPPHPTSEQEELVMNPPLPPTPPLPPLPPPPAPARPTRPATPPPPAWHDVPPPGIEEPPPPLPSEPPKPKQEIGDELASFYSDLAELEKQTPSLPNTAHNSPEHTHTPPPLPSISETPEVKKKEKEKEEKTKKKTKVKISSSIGMKHKSVSSLVAKWQQVAEEIHSD